MKTLTIKKKLIAILVILPLLPVFIFTFFVVGKIKEDSIHTFVHSTIKELEHVDRGFTFFMGGIKSKVKLLASSPLLQEAYGTLPRYMDRVTESYVPVDQLGEAAARVFDLLDRTQQSSSALQEVFIGTENGEFFSESDAKLPAGYDPRKRDWYKKTKNFGGGGMYPLLILAHQGAWW